MSIIGNDSRHAMISSVHNTVTLTVPTNDDPNGVLKFASDTIELSVAEDYVSGEVNSSYARFDIVREQGSFGHVKVFVCL